jgi:hypothetical protein
VQKQLKEHWHDAEHKQANKIINRDEAENRAEDAKSAFMRAKRKREDLE